MLVVATVLPLSTIESSTTSSSSSSINNNNNNIAISTTSPARDDMDEWMTSTSVSSHCVIPRMATVSKESYVSIADIVAEQRSASAKKSKKRKRSANMMSNRVKRKKQTQNDDNGDGSAPAMKDGTTDKASRYSNTWHDLVDQP